MRSQGQVRFITITSRMQIAAASLVAALLIGWALSMAVMAVFQWQASSERASLMSREAKVAKAASRVKAYRDNLDEVADDLGRRQDFIESVLPMLPDDVLPDETVSDSKAEADKTVAKVSAAIPEAGALARLEARQIAFVERLTRFADRRAARAEKALRTLGLDPRGILRASHTAQGGPLEKLSTARDGSIDPRFERMGASLERMDALERGLSGVPQVMPADSSLISSGFGYRRDPFNGHAAMHAGLDFRGAVGAPIHAAAAGRVSFVGMRSGYGKVVEVSHGNGLMTRYAHMSQWKAKAGQQVAAGAVIGAIGSTGRSTGPHLHFEVRINGRAVNPRPFLETAPHVLEEARASDAERRTPAGD
ncbi:peptidase M23 [Altererythrobacter sp. B11]|nr:M23 family metallopeptidase [Altererythrobacter sp. B11]BBC71418.1 peptidase M23 [Altererythrobacter sp. B11]